MFKLEIEAIQLKLNRKKETRPEAGLLRKRGPKAMFSNFYEPCSETQRKPRPPDTALINLALGRPGAQPRAKRFFIIFIKSLAAAAAAAANSLRNLRETLWFCAAGIANLKIAGKRPDFLARFVSQIYNVQIGN